MRALQNRYVIATTGGLLLAAAFPFAGVAGLAWVAPGMVLMSALGSRDGQAFRLGYTAGLGRSLATYYWLLLIPFPMGAIAGWLALSAYLGLYMGVWVWFCWRLFPRGTFDKTRDNAGGWIERFSSTNLVQRQVWAFACAAVWVSLEMVQSRFLTGFPWNFLGVSQYQMLPVIQIASYAGVYGISFVMVWFSVSLSCAALSGLGQRTAMRIFWGDVMLPLVVVAGVAWHGVGQMVESPAPQRFITAALIQPSIPQTLIWDPNENTNRFRQLVALSKRALEKEPDVLIWPEAAVPNLLRYEPEAFEAITNLVRTSRAWMILGADDAVPRSGRERQFDFYNSSFLVSPGGELKAGYRKRRLVAFGEYIPMVRWLPFLRQLLPIGDGFTPGDRPIPFELTGLNVVTSVLICFEDTFPHLAREYVSDDTDFLLNLTNNGWFGESAAQWQHAATAVFRAIENGLPLVRCANNGLSCWVDPLGSIHAVHFDQGPDDIYGAGFKLVRIPIFERRAPTFYNTYGDWFGWGCVMASGVMFATSAWCNRVRRNDR